MSGLPIPPRRVFGVALDVRDEAGGHTWVCRGTPGADGLRVESVDLFSELPGGCVDRDAAYRVLLAKVIEAPRSAWGFDFPFGTALADTSAAAPPPHVVAPWREGWLADVRRLSDAPPGPSTVPAPRRIERELGLEPMPWPHRCVAVAGVLRPLLAQASVAVLPFDALGVAAPGTPPAMLARLPSIHVFEAAPAALLRSLTLDGRDPAAVLRSLSELQLVRPLPRALRQRIAGAPAGRGLDAVLVAVAAWRGSRRRDHGELTRDRWYGREGYVYC